MEVSVYIRFGGHVDFATAEDDAQVCTSCAAVI